MMKRLLLVMAALALVGLACGLGGGGAESTISETGAPEGGVPMTKATPTAQAGGPPAETPTEQPMSPPEATSPPEQPTTAPGPRPTNAPGQKPGVEVLDVNVVGREDRFSVIGLVKNVTSTDFYAVWFTVTFVDAQGEVLSQEIGSTDTHLLPAGGVTSFEVLFPEGIPPNPDSVGVLLEWREKTAGDEWTREGFEVVSSDGKMGEDGFRVTGEVRNAGSLNAPGVSIVVLAFNAEGRLVGKSFAVVSNLAAGASAPFNVNISNLAGPDVARHEILVEGFRR